MIAAGFSFGPALPLAFLVAGALGAAMHLMSVSVPYAETLIGLSVLLLGLVVAVRRPLPVAAVVALFAGAGFFHGYALMESISAPRAHRWWLLHRHGGDPVRLRSRLCSPRAG